jgi:lipoprotein signal peptidase
MQAAVLCLVVVIADQCAKALATRLLPPVDGHAARPRFAWRLNGDCTVARVGVPLTLTLLLSAASVLIVVSPSLPALATVGGMAAVGGALGNVTDVLRRGAVVDFLILWPHTRGNLADLALVLGAETVLAGAAV